MPTPNSNFDYLATTTLQHASSEIADNYTNHIGLLWMINKGKGKRTLNGGTKILEAIAHEKNSTFGMIAKSGTISTTIQNPYTNAELDWKYAAGAIAYYDADIQMNRSKEQVYNLLTNLKKDAMRSLKETIAEGIYSSGVGDELNGIQQIVAEDPSTGTYAGINRATSTNAFWRNYSHDTGVTAFGTAEAGQIAMNTTYLSCVRGTEHPTLEVTTLQIWQWYMQTLATNQRYTDKESANAGFTNIMHFNIPVIFDFYCPEGNLYTLNTNFLHWNVMSGRDGWVEGFYPADNQLTYSSKVATYGNMSCSNCKLQGVIDSITAYV